MSTYARRVIGAAGVIAAVVAAATVVSGATAAEPSGGRIALFATIGNGPTGKVVLAGAIGDFGTAVSIDKSGRPDQNGNFVKVTLRKGSFELDSTALNKATSSTPPEVASASTCSVSASGSAPVTLFNGTGLYKGISGALHLTLSWAGVGRRYASGPNKGQCVRSDKQPPLSMVGSVKGDGTVHFAA